MLGECSFSLSSLKSISYTKWNQSDRKEGERSVALVFKAGICCLQVMQSGDLKTFEVTSLINNHMFSLWFFMRKVGLVSLLTRITLKIPLTGMYFSLHDSLVNVASSF